VKSLHPVHFSTIPYRFSPLILNYFVFDMYVSILKIGTKMYKKMMARVNPDRIVKKPLVPDL
jgi:hypothetical protein